MAGEVRVQERVGEIAGAGQPARDVLVTLIRAGQSKNGYVYKEETLRRAERLFEGATAFCDHRGRGALGRSVRDVVGAYRSVRFRDGTLHGVLRLLDGEIAELVEKVLADRATGLPTPDVGLSADMLVRLEEGRPGRPVVEEILQVNSVDVVFGPSAGGAFERMAESEQREQAARGGMMGEGEAVQEQVSRELAAIQEARLALCGDLLTGRLAASGLPEAARRKLAGQFVGRLFEAQELEQALSEMRTLVGALTEQGTVQGMGGETRVRSGLGLRDRLQYAADRLFGMEPPDALRGSVPRPAGLREVFRAAGFDGALGWEARRITEANEVTTSVMANIVGVSMNKRLVKDYAAQPKWWKPIASEVAVRDMKEQERVRLNDFASLSAVAENGAYSNLAWDDAKETYTPAKKGNVVYVTLETIINDDMQAVQSIPKKLARAAGVTINEFVAGLFTANGGEGATMADAHHVFDAANHQGNKGVAALDATSFAAAMLAIAKTTDSAGKRMGLRGAWLLIPPELEAAAFTILYSQLKPGSADNDRNFLQGRAQYIVSPQFSDASDWYLLTDPAQIELIEIGYLNGQDTPELLVQDDAAAGTVFTNDAISYKVRWIFGGGWLDYRGAYGAVVA